LTDRLIELENVTRADVCGGTGTRVANCNWTKISVIAFGPEE